MITIIYYCVCIDKFKLTPGATCPIGYRPLTSSWQDCEAAAKSLGFKGDNVCCVEYNGPWGTTRPQGCFQSRSNKRIHFNRGKGGNFEGDDAILCQFQGKSGSIYIYLYGAINTFCPLKSVGV